MGAGNDGGNSKLLLSEYIIDHVQFDENGSSNQWQGSTAQEWCADFYASVLTRGEQAVLVRTSKDDAEFCDDPGIFGESYGTSRLEDEYVFFLSAQEAGEVYFTDPNDRVARDLRDPNESEDWWWLRSPSADFDNSSGIVTPVGELYSIDVDLPFGARPAFNLNLSSVLFTSFVSAYYNGYKLTLLDGELTIAPSTPSRDGSVITVPYTLGGDAAADDTKVYALVTDKAYTESGAKVLQYTALAVNGDGAGIFTLDTDAVTGTWGADYHVYLLAVNEGFELLQTDYASAPVELREPAPHREPEDAFHMSGDASAKMKVKDKLRIVVDGYKVKKYETSDGTVAKVTKQGLVKAVGAGKARITVTTTEKLKKGKDKTLVLTVKVTEPNAPAKVSIEQGDKATLRVGEKLKLTAVVKPERAQTNLTWTTSDRSVATVSEKGVVKARKEGKVDITVTTDNGKSATIRIRVKEKK